MMGDRDVPEGFEPWVVKFAPKECPRRGERESCLYELDGIKRFMTKRFDRAGFPPPWTPTTEWDKEWANDRRWS